MCPHSPSCPTATDSDRDAARVIAGHPEQGWSLLCNGVVLFDDTGELLPDGGTVAPRRVLPGPRPAVPLQRRYADAFPVGRPAGARRSA